MDIDEEIVDNSCYIRLKTVIETITHSGLRQLDSDLFKEVKKICRLSPATTMKTYSLILYQMKKNHAEIRYLALQMCVELFKRSALFRDLITKDLKLIFELTAETNPKKKLPPPKAVAKIMENFALAVIKKWNDEYGSTFKEIKIAYQYLKHSKKVNFETMMTNNVREIQREEHNKKLKEQRMEKLISEIDSNEPEIKVIIIAVANCLSLLIPSPENFFINTTNNDTIIDDPQDSSYDRLCDKIEEESEINLKNFGILKNYNIILNPDLGSGKIEICKNEENSSVIQNLEDNVKLLRVRFLPLIKKWSNICVKYSSDNGVTLRKILQTKEEIEKCIKKYEELNITDNGLSCKSVCDGDISDDDDDDDFVEVKKENYENSAPDIEEFSIGCPSSMKPKDVERGWKISVGEDGDPASAVSTLKNLKEKGSSMDDSQSHKMNEVEITSNAEQALLSPKNVTRKDKLLASAPKVPFDIDLYHWEDQNVTAPTLLSTKMDNPKFWGGSSEDMDEIPNPEGIAAIRTRVIEFSGKFEPVKWSCRAPLPNGKLCPRKDRFKCPFHGKIIARDETGACISNDNPHNPEKKMNDDWQDPELLDDIKNATGIDLKMPSKTQKLCKNNYSKTHKVMETSSTTLNEIKKRKFPGLTDTCGKNNNSYKRISKKIFKRKALNKVAETLDKMDFIKHRDKFGDQFNYVYET